MSNKDLKFALNLDKKNYCTAIVQSLVKLINYFWIKDMYFMKQNDIIDTIIRFVRYSKILHSARPTVLLASCNIFLY